MTNFIKSAVSAQLSNIFFARGPFETVISRDELTKTFGDKGKRKLW
jgi:hypothetical protein